MAWTRSINILCGRIHRRTQKFESPLFQVQSPGSPQKSAEKEEDVRPKNKMNKTFVLSGVRKMTESHPVSKPVSLPDFQNGNDMREVRGE